jgi:Benzoyl-CoA reductase/2-hydroxyglutaryl-CoA dehydratase subunit, BcrC/BadD/HgdB
MANTAARETLLADSTIKGVIYHTIKFCDFYSFEYAAIKRTVPMLKLETDFTPASAGQLKTRLEAFFETLELQESMPKQQSNKGATGKHYIGIDIGSPWLCSLVFPLPSPFCTVYGLCVHNKPYTVRLSSCFTKNVCNAVHFMLFS